MIKGNYPTHTTGSDGNVSPEAMIKKAIREGFKEYAITDHYFFPKGFRNWGNDFCSEEHFRKLKLLKKKYSSKIKILIGSEFDWLKDYKQWILNEAKRDLDIKIISVHFLKLGDEYYPVDHSDELFDEMISNVRSIKNLVRQYYKELRNAIKTRVFDVVGHMDLIKIWNKDNKYFSDNEKWYVKEVIRTLKEIKKSGMSLDINTAGWRNPCNEIYPSSWIIAEAERLNIPCLISTDAHRLKEVGYKVNEAKKLIKSKNRCTTTP